MIAVVIQWKALKSRQTFFLGRAVYILCFPFSRCVVHLGASIKILVQKQLAESILLTILVIDEQNKWQHLNTFK